MTISGAELHSEVRIERCPRCRYSDCILSRRRWSSWALLKGRAHERDWTRTDDIQFGKDQAAITSVNSPYQPCEKIRVPSGVGFQPTQALANRRNFAAGLLLEGERGEGEENELLLSVAEVARRLPVSTATVYGLCASGKLAHVRLLNVIRVRPEDLRVF